MDSSVKKYQDFKNRLKSELGKFEVVTIDSMDDLVDKFPDLHPLIHIGGNSYIKKNDEEAYMNAVSSFSKERRELLKDDNFIINMFLYEMENNKSSLLFDNKVLKECLISEDSFLVDDRLKNLYLQAKKNYISSRNIGSCFDLVKRKVKKPEYEVQRNKETLGGIWTVDSWRKEDIIFQLLDEGYTERIFISGELDVIRDYKGDLTFKLGSLESLSALAIRV